MTVLIGAVDHFYEVIPGHWLMIGWSGLLDLKQICLETGSLQRRLVQICPVRLPRTDVAEALNDVHLKSAGFVAFVVGNDCAKVDSVLLGSQSVVCNPIPLSSEYISWPSQLQDILNLLQFQSLSEADLKQILLFGLLDLVNEGAYHWNSQQPWMHHVFQRRQLGCRYGQHEITMVLVANDPHHQPLLDYLTRLCWDPWCINGRVHILLICDQIGCPQRLPEELQKMLSLHQICIDLISPELRIGLFECMNLGIYLASTKTILIDPSFLIFHLSGLLKGLLGNGLLEPQRLIVPSLDDGLGPVCPPLMFSRDCFFDLGALQNLNLAVTSISQYLSQTFAMNPTYGLRHVDDLSANALISKTHSQHLQSQTKIQPFDLWQRAVKALLFVS